MRRLNGQCGFTLSEVLIVVAILAILVSVMGGLGKRLKNQADEKLCRSTIEVLVAAIEQYYDYHGSFPDPGLTGDPDAIENLYEQLYSLPNSRKLCEKIQASLTGDTDGDGRSEFLDPWDNALRYEYVLGTSFPDITSAGLDGFFGPPQGSAADNITSK